MRIDCKKARELIEKDLKLEMLNNEERNNLLHHTEQCQACRKYYMDELNIPSQR